MSKPDQSQRIAELEALDDRLQALIRERALTVIERHNHIRTMHAEGFTSKQLRELLGGVSKQYVHRLIHAEAIDRSDRRRLLREQKEHDIRTAPY